MKQRRCERNARKAWKDIKDKMSNKKKGKEGGKKKRNRKKVSE